MKNILVIGAGRSSSAMITYLLNEAQKHQWFVTVADADPKRAAERVNNHPNGRGTWLNVLKPNDRRDLMLRADIIVSLLPPHLHYRVARDCIKYRKQLVTASYVNRDLYRLDKNELDSELFYMGEMGLDPGLDHMSSKKVIDEIRAKGGKVSSFRTYMGDLLAPETEDTPWGYKFTWNPRNSVLTGQGVSQYQIKNKYKYIPYNRLFSNYTMEQVDGLGEFEAYANRDSLLFRDQYGLGDIPTLKRSILRKKGFCAAWDALIQLGLTDDNYPILDSHKLTYRNLLEAYLVGYQEGNTSLKDRIAQALNEEPDSEVMQKLEWLGLFERKKINLSKATPAQILEDLLTKKWTLKEDDKDMVIMKHVIKYRLNGKNYRTTSQMILKGNDKNDTAIAKVVGLPTAICAKLVMLGKIQEKGLQVPIQPEVYNPVLEELKTFGIEFIEKTEKI